MESETKRKSLELGTLLKIHEKLLPPLTLPLPSSKKDISTHTTIDFPEHVFLLECLRESSWASSSMRKRTISVIIVVALLAVGIPLVSSFSFASSPPPQTFVANLSAASGVTSQATGKAIFQLSPDGNSLSYTLRVSNINNVFMAHIHLFPSGDILVWLYPNPNTVASGGEAACIAVLSGGSASSCPGYIAGRFDGVLAQGTITAADLTGSTTCAGCLGITFSTLISDIESGHAYVNVHTTQNPGGEIQGTIAAPSHPTHIRFKSSLVGSTPGVTIGGIGSGGVPWVVMSGNVEIDPNGMLHMSVVGLVISFPGSPLDGTTGPVRNVIASLVCDGTTGVTITSTNSVPLSSKGDALINQKIVLPSTCFAPAVLVRISGTTSGPVSNGPWIAVTGFTNQ